MRFAVLPNPFESFQNGIVINYIAEPLIHFITYGTVGFFYSRGSNAAVGSFLYLFFYSFNIALIFLWSYLGATKLAGAAIILVYIFLLMRVSSRISKY